MLAHLSRLLGGTKPKSCQELRLVFDLKHEKYTVQFPQAIQIQRQCGCVYTRLETTEKTAWWSSNCITHVLDSSETPLSAQKTKCNKVMSSLPLNLLGLKRLREQVATTKWELLQKSWFMIQ